MSKIIHIRDVPAATHEALTAAAERRGLSLSSYLRAELADLARRDERLAENRATIAETRQQVTSRPGRRRVREAVEEGRRG